MNVSIFSKMVYENKSDWTLGKNKPNSNPIQSQSKPIKPNLPDAQMSVNSILTKEYERNDIFAVSENKAKTNPIQSQFQYLTYPQRAKRKHNYFPMVLFPLTLSTARDYNEIFSLISCFQRTQNERDLEMDKNNLTRRRFWILRRINCCWQLVIVSSGR
jgi:hypothetical protein